MVYITQNLNWLKISILKAIQIIIWYRKEKLQGLEGGFTSRDGCGKVQERDGALGCQYY